jgi:hypothetical protein
MIQPGHSRRLGPRISAQPAFALTSFNCRIVQATHECAASLTCARRRVAARSIHIRAVAVPMKSHARIAIV